MANTKARFPCALSLSDMPAEILQDILWASLELSLCLVSKQTYQKLPNYTRLARFLPLLAFGSELIFHKIVHNDGDDCSDILANLSLTTRFDVRDRFRLQKSILQSGWFKFSHFVNISHTLEEYLTQHLWIDAGITTEPCSLKAFAKRKTRKAAVLHVWGQDEDGHFYHLHLQRSKIHVARFQAGSDLDGYPVESELVQFLQICCVPNKLLRAPLPHPYASFGESGRKNLKRRLGHPMPEFFCFLWEKAETYPSDPDLLWVSPKAVENALFGAISTSNYYMIEALTILFFTTDGKNMLGPVTAEHFVAAASRFDRTAMRLLWEGVGVKHAVFPYRGREVKPHDIFPFEEREVMVWMKRAEKQARRTPCSRVALIDYIKYCKQEKENKRDPELRRWWRHERGCRCLRQAKSQMLPKRANNVTATADTTG